MIKLLDFINILFMNKLGYIRVAAVSPETRVADVDFNINEIMRMVRVAEESHADVAVFPELSVTGYTCGDLFYQQNLLDKTEEALLRLAEFSTEIGTVIVVGAPLRSGSRLFNCAVVIGNGKILGAVPKTHLPNYNEFYEKRWFSDSSSIIYSADVNSGITNISSRTLFEINGAVVGIEICEDLWVPTPPSCAMAVNGAEVILNLSASNEQAGKHRYLVDLIKQQSARCRCAYVYSSAGLGESSTDLVFSGNCIIAENGSILAESERFTLDPKIEIRDVDIEMLRNDRLKYSTFAECKTNDYTIVKASDNKHDYGSEIMRVVSPHPFTDGERSHLRERCDEISSIQAWGLAQRLRAINCKNTVIGISGGLDSTLALLVTVKAYDMLGLDRKGITAITMPGFGTTSRTRSNAWKLMELLGVTILEIPIGEAVEQHFKAIGHDSSIHDATYENSQARERTQILMDMANKTGGIVVGTGDLSELALGWCTYNGDQMSMYGVNASVPKTLVRYLVEGYAETSDNPEIKKVLIDIVDTPISPELLPAAKDDSIEQKTEDLVGPYELHDFFLHGMLRHSFPPEKIYLLACHAFAGVYDKDTIKHWLKVFYRRFFSQQFKRSCMPDGMKVGSVCLSPRGDWRMPSDASSKLWINEVENL